MAASASIIEPVEERTWVFKTPQTDRLMIQGIVDDMQARGLQTVAFMGLDDAFGEGGLVELQNLAAENDVEITTVERYGRTDTNVTPQTLRAVSSNPDAVLVWGVVRDSALVVQALRDRGFDGQIYVSHGVGNPTFLEQAGEAAEGVRLPIGPMIVVDELADDNPIKAVAQGYIEDYEAAYGAGTASTFGGHAWDAYQLLQLAIEDAVANGADLSDLAGGAGGDSGLARGHHPLCRRGRRVRLHRRGPPRPGRPRAGHRRDCRQRLDLGGRVNLRGAGGKTRPSSYFVRHTYHPLF